MDDLTFWETVLVWEATGFVVGLVGIAIIRLYMLLEEKKQR